MTMTQLFDEHAGRDPTGTLKLRKAFRATAKLRLRQLRAAMRTAVVDHNILGFPSDGKLSFHPPTVRLHAFSRWLDATGRQILLGGDWVRPYVDRAYRKGQHDAMQETGAASAGMDHSDAIMTLAGVEVEGILSATVQQTTRAAASVIARGTKRPEALRQLFKAFDKVSQNRLAVMADVLSVKAYNDAKLRTYHNAGVKRIGVHAEHLPHQHRRALDRVSDAERPGELAEHGTLELVGKAAELYEQLAAIEAEAALGGRAGLQRELEEGLVGVLTAGDNKVCQLCEDFAEDAPYEIDEVLDVLPMHPRCRCAVFPWDDKRFRGEDKAPTVEYIEAQHPRGWHGWWAEKGVVASRNVTSKKVKLVGYARPDVAAMSQDPANFKHDAFLFSNEYAYPNFRTGELHGDAADRVRAVVDHMKKNIRFMYDNAPDSVKKSGMGWYQKAHDIAETAASHYAIDTYSASAVIATLSPQKDWDQNIYLANAMLEINGKQQDHLWDDEMESTSQRIWIPKLKKNATPLQVQKFPAKLEAAQKQVEAVRGKKLSELTSSTDKAVWIRTYDEAHSTREYRSFDTGEPALTKAGKPKKAAWQSTPAIASAVEALESKGDLDVISAALGEKHKVRSFYNNIVAPMAPNGDVTVDTHAVGVALLRPLSGKATAVMQALATSPQGEKPPHWEAASQSKVTGVKGTYPVYADAYREVAEELQILPQQLQAITWQEKRLLFKINDAAKVSVESEWVKYKNQEQNLEATQQNVLNISRSNQSEEADDDDE